MMRNPQTQFTTRRHGTRRHCGVAAIALAVCLASTQSSADPARHGNESFTEPFATIEVAASESGRLTSVSVARGDIVAAGTLLMELDASVLEASRRVASQEAESTSRLEALRIDEASKQRRYDTLKGLRAGAATPEELLTAESDLRIAELQVRTEEESLERLKLELAEFEARIAQRQVRAPIDGIITEVLYDAGEFVASSEPHVATLVDLSRLRATFFVPTIAVQSLTEDANVRVWMQSANGVEETEIEVGGRVEYVGPLTQADSGRVRIDILIENPEGRYRSGVRVRLDQPAPTRVAAE
jgi:RND family efflux transporter MFP subunit